uniref:RNA-directed DNA polymerase, eukaryota, reverse transcriptase zinc-binding domain protein n=1 Tax=Tanacetum cinerariifolium TaxID=118510 RepID=A0A6L2NKN9_TANCI|nr:RNA-directed DNA polymerase, eukaryota, reverse transcriptase zinc-binding domain protein [Tanacetum cinerariifolium]
MDDFDKIVHDAWREVPTYSNNAMANLMQKLKFTKNKIRSWNRTRQSITNRKRTLQQELGKLDMTIDNGKATEEDLLHRMEICNSIQDLDKLHIMKVAQKAKVKWAVERDENSEFYHGILNKKRNQLAIRGPSQERPILNMEFPNQLNPSQVLDLEAEVSIEEIKKVVWDCGTDKAPRPDGVTFGFYKRFWGLIESDVVAAVKWCGWIYKCLRTSRGSVLVNGSSTEEFQLFKCLKQGDPLAPFLFILVMESFHISFRVCFKWNSNNIDTIIHVLKCFHLASGLNINLGKSKLMGIAVNDVYVHQAVNKIGCGVLHTPFTYLGSKVGGNMSRNNVWDDIVDKLVVRLSKWKMKTLSIGGRLTLLKMVLGAMSIYHMSIFKVPLKVLHPLKEKGGIGVSSLYALNRALLFKWVWRFKTQKDLLWTRVIKAIHGDKGRIGVGSKVNHKSIWCDIVREVHAVKMQGFDILNYMQKKIGSEKDTFFWDDVWLGDTPLKYRFPRVYSLEVNKHVDVASKMSQVNLSASLRCCSRGGAEQSQMGELIALLNDVVLGVMDDRWCWVWMAWDCQFRLSFVRCVELRLNRPRIFSLAALLGDMAQQHQDAFQVKEVARRGLFCFLVASMGVSEQADLCYSVPIVSLCLSLCELLPFASCACVFVSLALLETKWKGSSNREANGCKPWYSDSPTARNGVGVILNECLKDKVAHVNRCSDKIISLMFVIDGDTEQRRRDTQVSMEASEALAACDADSMWNTFSSIIKDVAKDTPGVAIGKSNTHAAQRKSWWLCEEVQSIVTVKQAWFRELLSCQEGNEEEWLGALERYKEAKRQAKKP